MSKWTTRLVLLFSALLAGSALGPRPPETHVWSVIAVDPKNDGREPLLADAAQLSYRYDRLTDMLWFRVSLFGKPNPDAFGVNIAVDTASRDDARASWWGANKEFTFDRLVTAWVTRVNGSYEGTIGVSDAAGARTKHLTNMRQNNLQLRVDGDSILIGIKRADLTDTMTMNLIAAVGSGEHMNDDIPNSRSATIDLSAPRPARGLREIDVSRNNLKFGPDETTLADSAPPRISKRGRGPETLILIPGVYSGVTAFDGFLMRNGSAYTCYVVTPPGLGGTPARQLPPETASYGELTWTRRLGRDVLDLIERQHLDKPIIVTHGFPGSLAAEELALSHPGRLGGIVEVASMPTQVFPSFRNPGREATPDERVAVVDESWAQHWFKYVTPETWESNNYPAAMFANDPIRAERVRQDSEAPSLPVKIRYLVEYMASDHRADFGRLGVPMLALKPGFNEKLLVDPAYTWFKARFHDAWEGFPKNARFELLAIPDSRALMLDDQPRLMDEAIARFVTVTRTASSGPDPIAR